MFQKIEACRQEGEPVVQQFKKSFYCDNKRVLTFGLLRIAKQSIGKNIERREGKEEH